MSIQLRRKAIKLYSNPENPKWLNRKMQRQWIASMEFLGDRHALRKTSPRLTTQDPRILR
jgi:hypothetical protein